MNHTAAAARWGTASSSWEQHQPQNKAKKNSSYLDITWLSKMQSQVFTRPGKVLSRLLNTELLEISSCEPQSRNLSFTWTLHPLLPSGLKLENSSQRRWHISSQPACHTKTASSFPASSSLFSVFVYFLLPQRADSILSKGCPKLYEPQHLSVTLPHEMQNFTLLLTNTPLKCSGPEQSKHQI